IRPAMGAFCGRAAEGPPPSGQLMGGAAASASLSRGDLDARLGGRVGATLPYVMTRNFLFCRGDDFVPPGAGRGSAILRRPWQARLSLCAPGSLSPPSRSSARSPAPGRTTAAEEAEEATQGRRGEGRPSRREERARARSEEHTSEL